jgi:hypothetical protein
MGNYYSFDSPGWELQPGLYDVIQSGPQARTRPSKADYPSTGGRQKGQGPAGRARRKRRRLRLAAFAAGTIVGFGVIPGGIPVTRTSGLARLGVSLGVAGVSAAVGKRIPAAPGTFAYGVAFGSALTASYEGWSILDDIFDVSAGFGQYHVAGTLTKTQAIRTEKALEVIKRWLGL